MNIINPHTISIVAVSNGWKLEAYDYRGGKCASMESVFNNKCELVQSVIDMLPTSQEGRCFGETTGHVDMVADLNRQIQEALAERETAVRNYVEILEGRPDPVMAKSLKDWQEVAINRLSVIQQQRQDIQDRDGVIGGIKFKDRHIAGLEAQVATLEKQNDNQDKLIGELTAERDVAERLAHDLQTALFGAMSANPNDAHDEVLNRYDRWLKAPGVGPRWERARFPDAYPGQLTCAGEEMMPTTEPDPNHDGNRDSV